MRCDSAALYKTILRVGGDSGEGVQRFPGNVTDEEKWALCWHKRSGGLVHSADIGLTKALFFFVSPNIHVLVYLDPECM